MFGPKYLLVQRDHVTRGVYVISYHWLRWRADWKARHLSDRHAAEHARQAAPYIDARMPRFTWEVDRRCA